MHFIGIRNKPQKWIQFHLVHFDVRWWIEWDISMNLCSRMKIMSSMPVLERRVVESGLILPYVQFILQGQLWVNSHGNTGVMDSGSGVCFVAIPKLFVGGRLCLHYLYLV